MTKDKNAQIMESMTFKLPIQHVIEIIGGVRKTAKKLNLRPSTIRGWRDRETLPSKHQLKILEIADIEGLDITPEDLIKGRRIEKK